MSVEIAVVGGRGKTGRAVISALSHFGASARAVGRAELVDPVAAFSGCDAIYLMAPNMHPDEVSFVRELLAAAHEAGVRRVVYHSVAAPYVPEMPHHLGKAESERLVRTSGLAWTILQPCAYVQNFLPQLAAAEPAISVPYNADRLFGLIDLNDVGDVAARALLEPDLIGSTLEIGGPALVSVRELVHVASEVLGKVVPLTVISGPEWSRGPGAGLEAREHDWLLAMFNYYEHHGLPVGGVVTRAVLGRDPHSVRDVLSRELAALA